MSFKHLVWPSIVTTSFVFAIPLRQKTPYFRLCLKTVHAILFLDTYLLKRFLGSAGGASGTLAAALTCSS